MVKLFRRNNPKLHTVRQLQAKCQARNIPIKMGQMGTFDGSAGICDIEWKLLATAILLKKKEVEAFLRLA